MAELSSSVIYYSDSSDIKVDDNGVVITFKQPSIDTSTTFGNHRPAVICRVGISHERAKQLAEAIKGATEKGSEYDPTT